MTLTAKVNLITTRKNILEEIFDADPETPQGVSSNLLHLTLYNFLKLIGLVRLGRLQRDRHLIGLRHRVS